MKLLPALAATISAASLATARAEELEPGTYTQQSIEASAEYQAAALVKLSEQALPPDRRNGPVMPVPPPPPAPELAPERRQKLAASFHALALSFRCDTTGKPLELTNRADDLSLGFRGEPKGVYLSVNFDEKDRPQSLYIADYDKLPLNGMRMTTPEKFEAYAIECHRLAFGFKPQGELKLGHIWADEHGLSSSVSAEWTARPEGAPMLAMASLRADKDGLGRWSLNLKRGATASEVGEIAKIIQLNPTKISEAQAAAIAWKNWKTVRAARYQKGDYRIWSRLREISTEELDPWSDTRFAFQNERQAWLPAETPQQPVDPVAYAVHMADGLLQVDALVDRRSGKLLRLNQHRMSW